MREPTTTVLIAYLFILAVLLSGCESNSKIKQIQDGAANVEQHAQRIETAAQAD